jgi:hypothetical protein
MITLNKDKEYLNLCEKGCLFKGQPGQFFHFLKSDNFHKYSIESANSFPAICFKVS